MSADRVVCRIISGSREISFYVLDKHDRDHRRNVQGWEAEHASEFLERVAPMLRVPQSRYQELELVVNNAAIPGDCSLKEGGVAPVSTRLQLVSAARQKSEEACCSMRNKTRG